MSTVRRVFRGDLETIVDHALRKEPDERYQSAGELAADIRRYLSHEPIVARPASTMYQMRKFAQRNRALVGGVAGVFVMLIVAIIGTSLGMMQAQRERDEAEHQRQDCPE